MKYAVVFQSRTGNTRLLAQFIYRDIRAGDKSICDLDEGHGVPEADIYLVCFGIRDNSCGAEIIDCLERMEDTKIALFATCGYSPTEAYKAKLERSLTVWLPESAEYLGFFLCQGRVPAEQRERMLAASPNWAEAMAPMFEEGENHPNPDDLRAAALFLRRITEKAETRQIPIE